MDLNPARSAGDVLTVVLRSPALYKTHPDRTHLGELKYSTIAMVYRLKSTHQPTLTLFILQS